MLPNPAWNPATARKARKAAFRRTGVPQPMAFAPHTAGGMSLTSTACRAANGCFQIPGAPDASGHCMQLTQQPPRFMQYLGQDPGGWMRCQVDPACRVAMRTGHGHNVQPAPCEPHEQIGYRRSMLPATERDAWHSYSVCCPGTHPKRVATTTP